VILTVDPRGQRGRAPQRQTRRPRGPLTALSRTDRRATYLAPVTDPGGATRDEAWAAYSADGLWEYHRVDDGTLSPWRVVYVPTGQSLEVAGNLTDARERTAAGDLLRQLRATSYVDAFRGASVAARLSGQRTLAIHMRGEGIVTGRDADARCECGGLLIQATRTGRLAHVDACAECYTYGRGLVGDQCEHAAGHLFCADPRPVDCGHQRDNGCTVQAIPNRGDGCGGQADVDCCEGCCRGE
jgi:hypothetical protein